MPQALCWFIKSKRAKIEVLEAIGSPIVNYLFNGAQMLTGNVSVLVLNDWVEYLA